MVDSGFEVFDSEPFDADDSSDVICWVGVDSRWRIGSPKAEILLALASR